MALPLLDLKKPMIFYTQMLLPVLQATINYKYKNISFRKEGLKNKPYNYILKTVRIPLYSEIFKARLPFTVRNKISNTPPIK